MRNLPTVVGVADFSLCALFARPRTDRGCEFYPGYDEVKTQKRKALSIINDKVSIVKQLKNSSAAIIAERYGL